VELALKAMIAKQFKAEHIPDKAMVLGVYTHKLVDLVKLANLKAELEKRVDNEPEFDANWNTVVAWNESARYAKIERVRALAMLEAVDDARDGVYSWIRSKL
jgi:hypothetical protein